MVLLETKYYTFVKELKLPSCKIKYLDLKGRSEIVKTICIGKEDSF